MALQERKFGICPYSRESCGINESRKKCPEYVFQNCEFVLMSGSTNPELANEIEEIIQRKIYSPTSRFTDDEIDINKDQTLPGLGGKNVYILQSGYPDPNGSVMETLFMIDAAKRAGAEKIIPFLFYAPYTRGDRKDKPRTAIPSATVFRAWQERGATGFIAFDLHVDQEQGFVDVPLKIVWGSEAQIPIIKKNEDLSNLKAVAPDAGSVKRVNKIARKLGVDMAIIIKKRNPSMENEPETVGIIGDVEGGTAMLWDDEVQSAKTLRNAAILLKDSGAEHVIAAAIHGKFTGNALEIIEDSPIERIYITDTIAQRPEVLAHPKIRKVSVAEISADAILTTQAHGSLSERGLIL